MSSTRADQANECVHRMHGWNLRCPVKDPDRHSVSYSSASKSTSFERQSAFDNRDAFPRPSKAPTRHRIFSLLPGGLRQLMLRIQLPKPSRMTSRPYSNSSE
jgi:hypothetical protein